RCGRYRGASSGSSSGLGGIDTPSLQGGPDGTTCLGLTARGLMRRTVRSGGGFEEAAAYSRAVRIGSNVAVSATAAIDGGEVVHRGDTYRQTLTALEKALAAAAELGASKAMTLRTRLLLAVGA